jgi:hypothetical protein
MPSSSVLGRGCGSRFAAAKYTHGQGEQTIYKSRAPKLCAALIIRQTIG